MVKKKVISIISSVVILALASCVSSKESIDYSPANSVGRQEALRIAESYRVHQWTPSNANTKHGLDKDGILVNTPDINMDTQVAARPGWWFPNKINTGIPYKWGGFDTPKSFDKKISKGYYAGDVYTSSKRQKLWNGVSQKSCGVDCSGFISRCWRLDKAYSTRDLPGISTELSSFNELKPGDIVNKHNTHVLLFDRFVDVEKKWLLAYETGSAPSWKVLRHQIQVDYLKTKGYRPFRYKKIKQDTDTR